MGLINFILEGYVDMGVMLGNEKAIELAKRREMIRLRKQSKRRKKKKDGVSRHGSELNTWIASQSLLK